MNLSTLLLILIISIISSTCKKESLDSIPTIESIESTDPYKAEVQSPNKIFGEVFNSPLDIMLKKQILMGQTPIYQGGTCFATLCKKTETEYLVIATGYSEYSDFAYSELVTLDLNISTNLTSEIQLYQRNIAKIQTGGSSLLRISNKTILCFFYGKESNSVINIYMKKSIDNGFTWTSPTQINTIQNEYQHTTANRAILLSTGRIIIPMTIGGTGGSNYIFCYYSDDLGINWKATRKFNMVNYLLFEPCIEELENGKLIMTVRNNSGKIFFAFSEDKGLHWINFFQSELTSPDAPSVIAEIKGKKTLVLIWNNNSRIYDYQLRTPLSLAISHDEGKTWHYKFDIENRPNIGAYYPSITFVENRILITYTQRNYGDSKALVMLTEIPINLLTHLDSEKNN